MLRPLAFALSLGVAFAAVPARAADVDPAVKKGAEFLDAQYAKGVANETYKLGSAALSGIALLEAGIKVDSPGLATIIKALRDEALAQTETYHVALAILF